jgi:FHA domain
VNCPGVAETDALVMVALRCSGGPVTAGELCARVDSLDEAAIAVALARLRNEARIGARRGRDGAWRYEVGGPVAEAAVTGPPPDSGLPAPAGEPVVQVTATRARVPLRLEVTTVGRGAFADIRLDDASVSVLHAELVCRGPYVYVADLGLSANGTLVNGRPVTRRLLASGDVLSFGASAAVITGLPAESAAVAEGLGRPAVPELTRREADVLAALCRPAFGHEAFTAPASSAEIAAALVITEAAVKQHLLHLYAKFRIPEGTNRRARLANTAIAAGLAPRPARPEYAGLPAARHRS